MDALSTVASLTRARHHAGAQTAVMRQEGRVEEPPREPAAPIQPPPAPGTGLVVDRRA